MHIFCLQCRWLIRWTISSRFNHNLWIFFWYEEVRRCTRNLNFSLIFLDILLLPYCAICTSDPWSIASRISYAWKLKIDLWLPLLQPAICDISTDWYWSPLCSIIIVSRLGESRSVHFFVGCTASFTLDNQYLVLGLLPVLTLARSYIRVGLQIVSVHVWVFRSWPLLLIGYFVACKSTDILKFNVLPLRSLVNLEFCSSCA